MTSLHHNPLNRLLRPRSVAVIGGKFAERAIRQCELLGFEGDIWPVNPHRQTMHSRRCFRSLQELPSAPDAAFVAVPRAATVELVGELQAMGAGGVVCYASGFAEGGVKGSEFQRRLDKAAGAMPLIGPNCYGVLNYLDGVALWPDEQGGKRCRKGVAIISQSGNITVSLTMQRRGVPVSFLISTGNMAGVKTHDYIFAMLENPEVTAIGLYLEGVVEAHEFSVAAIEALKRKIPIVVLESGQSEVGADVARTHSYSLSSDSQVSRAFYDRYGIIQVDSIPQMLETLKLVSLIEPIDNRTIASISCSGGEAALMADLVAQNGLEFAEFSESQKHRLHTVLGDRVAIANPLDYHTYIWGNPTAQKECFESVYVGSQNVSVNVIDFPMQGVCDPLEWDYAAQAIADAKDSANARVVTVATLHENYPVKYQQMMLKHSIAPMFGMPECIGAIAASVQFAAKAKCADDLVPLIEKPEESMQAVTLTEYQGKCKLKNAGLPVVEGSVVRNLQAAKHVAATLGYPLVAKVSCSSVLHKSEVDGVVLGIDSDDQLNQAVDRLFELSEEVLIEQQVRDPIAELLVGIRLDPTFGPVLVLGAGGKLANLIEDSSVLHFPVCKSEVLASLHELKIGKVLGGYRGMAGDLDSVLEFIMKLASLASEKVNRIVEIEINPLYVYAQGLGVNVIDVVYRHGK